MKSTLMLSLLLLLESPIQQRGTRLTPTALSGQVVVDGGGQLPLLWPKLYVFAASSDSDRFVFQEDRSIRVKGRGAVARIAADGTFQLRGLADGLYSVTLVTGLGSKLPDGYSVKSIALDNRDVLKEKLLIPGPAGKSLRITLLQGKPPVTVNVRVTDALGRSIVGLGAADFQLWENGTEQKIDSVRKDEGPATIGIVVDLKPATAGVDSPVTAALSLLAQADPRDEFFLITPGREVTVAVDFTSDAARVSKALTSYYRLHGDTGGLTDGIRLGIRHAKAAANSRRFLVVISEGQARMRFPTEKEFAKLMADDYIQMFYIAPTPYLEQHPGSYGPEGDRVLAAIRNQYIISYHSTKPQDSKWHDIRVRLKNSKGFREPVDINARPGYYADLR